MHHTCRARQPPKPAFQPRTGTDQVSSPSPTPGEPSELSHPREQHGIRGEGDPRSRGLKFIEEPSGVVPPGEDAVTVSEEIFGRENASVWPQPLPNSSKDGGFHVRRAVRVPVERKYVLASPSAEMMEVRYRCRSRCCRAAAESAGHVRGNEHLLARPGGPKRRALCLQQARIIEDPLSIERSERVPDERRRR